MDGTLRRLERAILWGVRGCVELSKGLTMRTLSIAVVIAVLPVAAKADTIDDELNAQARDLTNRAPFQVDSGTRLDSAAYANSLFIYHYTVLRHASTEYSPAQKKKAAVLLKQQVTGRACTGSALRKYLAHGVTFKYVHFGNDNMQIAEAVVSQKDCDASTATTAKRAPPPSPGEKRLTTLYGLCRAPGGKTAREVYDLLGEPREDSDLGHWRRWVYAAPGGDIWVTFDKDGEGWKLEKCQRSKDGESGLKPFPFDASF
jgi:hypothetical protein